VSVSPFRETCVYTLVSHLDLLFDARYIIQKICWDVWINLDARYARPYV
jgi:hypothetical protein